MVCPRCAFQQQAKLSLTAQTTTWVSTSRSPYADTTTFPGADYYVIAVVQHREQMSSSLPATGTLLREYVQLETTANAAFSKRVALTNALLDGTSVPALMPDGSSSDCGG